MASLWKDRLEGDPEGCCISMWALVPMIYPILRRGRGVGRKWYLYLCILPVVFSHFVFLEFYIIHRVLVQGAIQRLRLYLRVM